MIYAIIIHHSSDLDGYGSAVTAIEWLNQKFNNLYIHTIPINYNSYNINNIIQTIKDKTVNATINDKIYIFILDFSLSYNELIKLDKLCDKLYWIDHHEQAEEIYDKFLKYIKNTNSDKYNITFRPSYKNDRNRLGAAGLTFQMLFPDAPTVPQILLAIAYHDVWRFDHNYIRPLISFIQILPWKNYHFLRKLIFKERIDGIDQHGPTLLNILITFGKLLEKFREKQIQSVMKYFSFGQYNSYNIAILNHTNSTITSDLLNMILNLHKNLDFSISYFDNLRDGIRTFSLRSLDDSVNVGEIAKTIANKYNMSGGGHPTAAGFSCPINEGIKLVNSFLKETNCDNIS